MQQSRRCSGSATQRDAWWSSSVIGSRKRASGLPAAHAPLPDGDRPELLARRAEAAHVPPGGEGVAAVRVARAGDDAEPGEPGGDRAGGPPVGVAGPLRRLQRGVGVDAHDRRRQPAGDGQRGELHLGDRRRTGLRDLAEDAEVGEAELAGEADVDAAGEPARHEQAVDVVEREAGVGDGQAGGVGGEVGGRAAVDLAGLGDAEADDGGTGELLEAVVCMVRPPAGRVSGTVTLGSPPARAPIRAGPGGGRDRGEAGLRS